MPLPTAAELTDPNATNTQMKQRLGQLAESALDREDAFQNALFNPVVLTENQFFHIDEIKESGYYICKTNTIAGTIAGLPAGSYAFILSVANDGDFTKQTLSYRSSSTEYHRTSNTAGNFPDFVETATQLDISTATDLKLNLLKEIILFEDSYNLYDPSKLVTNSRLNASGAISVVAGAKRTGFIPVIEGEKYTFSWSNTVTDRPNYAFFETSDSATPLEFNVTPSTSSPITVTTPSKAKFIVINLKHQESATERASFQFERGSTATAYQQFESVGLKIQDNLLPDNLVTTENLEQMQIEHPKSYELIVESVNLFNTNDLIHNCYLNTTTGRITGGAGWTISNFIPVTAGQAYTLSGQRSRQGVSFFATNVITSDPALSYSNDASMPLTVTAPAGANFAVIALESESVKGWTNIQFEKGTEATPYQEFGVGGAKVKASEIVGLDDLIGDADGSIYNITAGAGYLQSEDGFRLGVKIFNPKNHTSNPVFNFTGDSYNGVKIRSFGDDVAPTRMIGTTIGANHAYFGTKCTVTGHNKTTADIGSVWSASGKEWVIVNIVDANSIMITCRTDNTGLASATTLTHVSGAVNTSAFTPTAVASSSQWYQVTKNHSIKAFIDDHEDTRTTINRKFSKTLRISESYDLMEKNEMVEWLIANKGTDHLEYKASSALNVSNVHEFQRNLTDVIYCNFFTYKALSSAQDLMLTQSARLDLGVNGNIKYYIPRSIPFTHESVSYDFSVPFVVDSISLSNRIDITADRTESGAVLPNCLIQMNDTVGFAIGYLPILSASPEVRNTLTSKGVQISASNSKIYPYLVDGLTTLDAGVNYSAVAYRAYFKRPLETKRTVQYDIPSSYGDFLFLHWHGGSFTDVVQLPPYLQGRKFEIIEQTSNVEILTDLSTNILPVKIGTVTKNARLTLKFFRENS